MLSARRSSSLNGSLLGDEIGAYGEKEEKFDVCGGGVEGG